MKQTVSLLLALLVAILPINIQADPAPPPQQSEWAVAVCIMVGVGLAVTGIMIVSKRCQPKYYWLMDDDQPPTFWVGTATRKECQIQGWKKIGGPYDRPGDAPPIHPDPTNRVNEASSAMVLKISVQTSQDMVSWTTVHSEVSDIEDFVYYPTNTGFFRLEAGAQ